MKRELERIEIPGEHDARERTWAVVRAAQTEREVVSQPIRLAPLLAAATVAVILAAAFTPPGRAVVDRVREAVGVETADEALFSLPAGGRLLVTSDGGAWVVSADGGKRRLGDYLEASWSPFGRFVVAAGEHELAALSPEGDVEWKLARRDVRFPRWGGSRFDTRIAYLSGRELRIVAGDGKGDRRFAAHADPVAPSWRPATFHFIAYAARGRVIVADAESGRRFWSRRVAEIRRLEWSRTGEFLLVQGHRSLRVFDEHGRLRYELLLEQMSAPVTASAFAPSSRGVAFAQHAAGRSHVWVIPRLRPDGSAAREMFSGPGVFTELAWSPNGRWLLAAWRDAGQWLFVSTTGARRIRAVANVAREFESRRFPDIEGWCCP